jgi:hypothetical protein
MYSSKEIAEILKVPDKSVRRYLNSYFSINNGAYEVYEKMLEIQKDEYLDAVVDTVVQTYSAEEYDKLNVIIVEHPMLKDQLEYHRKSAESHNTQMEIILRTIEQKEFFRSKRKRI